MLPNKVITQRNGKQQACEPCRRRKVACNHAYPVCSRCQRKGQEVSCVYAVTKSSSLASYPEIERFAKASRQSEIDHESVLPSPGTLEGLSSAGYLGRTSFPAFFQEAQSNLTSAESLSVNAPGFLSTGGCTENGVMPSVKGKLAETQVLRAIEVLQTLPTDERTALALFRQNLNPNDGWIRMAGENSIISTWKAFGSYLSENRLREMAEIIFSNTHRPFIELEESSDLGMWFETFSGHNLRWESLAIIFAYLVLGATASSLPGEESRNLLLASKECCSLCISWADGSTNANVLLVYALYKRSIIEACISGEASFAYWNAHTAAIAMLTFVGLHVQTKPKLDPCEPTASSEVYRRLFCQIYIMDKVIATFVGRPPLLAWKYCTTPLPLDLDDEQLLSKSADLKQTFQNLDRYGWNKRPQLRASTILRARTMIAIAREEILEIALGRAEFYTCDSIMQLKSRQQEIYLQLPVYLVYNFHEDSRQIKPALFYTRILIRLEHLLNLFFLERLLSDKSKSIGGRDLLTISFEMLSLTTILWTHKDRLAGFQGEFEWLVIGHGAPAAGVLCNELVNPNLVLANANLSECAGTAFTRSSIIQQLSLLIGFLEWVGPSQPNRDLARAVRGIVKNVLDQTLNANTSLDLHTDMNEFFNFDLLDTFDWISNEASNARNAT